MLPISEFAETLSLVLVMATFVVFLGIVLRVRAHRGLQLDLFIFSLILFSSEVPHILNTLGILPMSEQFRVAGLGLHTLSMGVLCFAITYRFFQRIKHIGGTKDG